MTLVRPELGIPVIPGKLFLHCLQEKPRDTIIDHYFNFDEARNVFFEPMSRENGPPILPQITEFIKLIKDKLTRINKQIHICVSLGAESRVNCIFHLCAFLILEREFVTRVVGQTKAKDGEKKINISRRKDRMPDFDHPFTIFEEIFPPIEEFSDATASPFTTSLSDALNGFLKAVRLGWFDHQNFDSESYNFYLAPENGFMTWIVPHRLLILSAPAVADAPLLFDMLPLFRKWRIYSVVSFTTELRGSEDLGRVCIDHIVFNVSQDSLPSINDVIAFCDLCDQGKAVAIISLNGLGRGPLFAASWLIKSFGFQPKEAIGWVRNVRQGAIYGVQQDFLMRVERTFYPEAVQMAPQATGPTISMKNQALSPNKKKSSRIHNAGKIISK